MPRCVTCGREIDPERAQKYDYCMARECQEKNASGLTMVAVGVNKAAEQYMILDDRTREDLASGKYHDQRRGSFGSPARSSPSDAAARTARAAEPARRPARPPAARRATRHPWSRSQEKLALLYNEQRLRPDEIARKLGLSTYAVTQIILTARNQGKL
jgi:DNA-directed RNA polymerase subunit N (RpoN/RPB10)